ncbi:restriction endonuclease [Saccharothrix sp. ST-888]|uniref:restriction endonuclease n=1 Tax=Saccharothrix sp. ST-888 TaxID=1427391 RepID=UPI0018CEA5C0
MRNLVGADQHFKADIARFVSAPGFSRPAEAFAHGSGIIAIHRDRFANSSII